MADQAASSLSNVVVAVLVARSVGAAGFGAFGLAMVVFQIALGVVRALVGEPFLSRYAADPPTTRRLVAADLIAAAALVGLAGATVVGVAGVLLGGLAGSALGALALVLPMVLVHETLRFVYVVDRPGAALGIDLLWLVLVCIALLLAPMGAAVSWFVIAWGLSGGVAAATGAAISRAPLHRAQPRRWFRRTGGDGGRYLADFLTAQAAAQFALVALGAISSLSTLGAVRASQVFYGPLNTVHSGVYLAVVPDGTRLRGDPSRLRRLVLLTALVLAGMAAAWMAVGVALPDGVGRYLFDQTWPGARDIMVPMGISMIAGSVMAGGFLGVRSLGAADASLRSRLLSAPGQVIFPLIGAVVGGAAGFAFGAALSRLLASAIWWTAFRQELVTASVSPHRSDGSAHVLAAVRTGVRDGG